MIAIEKDPSSSRCSWRSPRRRIGRLRGDRRRDALDAGPSRGSGRRAGRRQPPLQCRHAAARRLADRAVAAEIDDADVPEGGRRADHRRPGSKDYGRSACWRRQLCEARIVIDVPARAFTPPPRKALALLAVARGDPEVHRRGQPPATIESAGAARDRRRSRPAPQDAALTVMRAVGETLLATTGVDPSLRAPETCRWIASAWRWPTRLDSASGQRRVGVAKLQLSSPRRRSSASISAGARTGEVRRASSSLST